MFFKHLYLYFIRTLLFPGDSVAKFASANKKKGKRKSNKEKEIRAKKQTLKFLLDFSLFECRVCCSSVREHSNASKVHDESISVNRYLTAYFRANCDQ